MVCHENFCPPAKNCPRAKMCSLLKIASFSPPIARLRDPDGRQHFSYHGLAVHCAEGVGNCQSIGGSRRYLYQSRKKPTVPDYKSDYRRRRRGLYGEREPRGFDRAGVLVFDEEDLPRRMHAE